MAESHEYRLVGGDRHGEVVTSEATFVYAPIKPEVFKAALDAIPPVIDKSRMVVAYRVASFGSKREAGPDMRLDVMLSSDLHDEAARDPRSEMVAWALLDAFMVDIPNARPVGERGSAARSRRGVIEARAALTRARRALPKAPEGTLSAASTVIAQGISRCDSAIEWLEGRDPLGSSMVIPAEEAPGG